MRKISSMFLVLALFVVAAVSANAGTARLQVIHNAADPAAEVVDIYVNGDLFIPDFAFRAATPFVEVPGETELNIGVAPGDSESADDAIAVFPVTLTSGRTYVAIANGVLDPGIYAENPDGNSIAFNIFARDGIQENAHWSNWVKLIAFHGATDAPTVDIMVKGEWFRWRMFNDLTYGEFSSYRSVYAKKYLLEVTPGNDNETVVATFEADLNGLGGGAAVVFASGFLDPSMNQDGAAFGLFAALPDGTVVELPAYAPTARLQVIHNAADPAAEMVDIYVNGDLFIPDFAFRAATPFVDVPAGVNLNIGVAPGNSSSVDDVIADFDVMLEEDKTYVAIANGVLDPNAFAENPDGESIAFTLFAKDGIREKAYWGNQIKVIGFHGATDAPTVDIIAKSDWRTMTLIDDLTYGDFSSYKSLYPMKYVLEVTPGGDNSVVVASFEADLSGLGGGAAVVFASGFLDPSMNQDGAGFGLFAALPDGTVVEFPAVQSLARLQVIHNAADPAAEVVDIYVNGDLFIPDFAFRTATPFVDVPAGVNLNIGVAPGNSASADDVIADFDVMLEDGRTYVAVANGVLDPGAFAENPDGRSIGFTLFARDGIRESINYSEWVKVIAFHGASDAPTVDIMVQGKWRWRYFNDLTYGEFSKYRLFRAKSYTLEVTPGNDNSTVVAAFEADLSGLGGGAAVVFASGFLDPTMNQNGAAFGLFAALPDGTVVEFPAVGGGGNDGADRLAGETLVPETFGLDQNYPNPFNPTTVISFSLPSSAQVDLKVYNVLGQTVRTLVDQYLEAGIHEVQFDAGNLSSGMYFYKIKADDYQDTRKMMLVK